MIEIPSWLFTGMLGTILALIAVIAYTLGWYGTFDKDDDEGGAV